MPQGIDSGLRLLRREPGFQSSNNVQPFGTPILKIVSAGNDLALHCDGSEDGGIVSRGHAAKARLRHADDRERMCVDRNALVNDLRIGGKLPLPIIETQHHQRTGLLRGVIGGNEEATESRLHSQHVEIIAGDKFGIGEFSRVAPLQIDLRVSGSDRPAENGIVVAQIAIHGIRKIKMMVAAGGRMAGILARIPEKSEAVRFLDGQTAQKRLIEQAEYRRIGANAERKRKNRNHREAGRLSQLANGVAEIMEQSGHLFFFLATRNAAPPWDRPRPRGAPADS